MSSRSTHMHTYSRSDVSSKNQESKEIEEALARFLKSGGKIKHLPGPGQGTDISVRKASIPAPIHRMAKGAV
jgi:hypothetical protein